jgi:chromosome segregation ATPase
VSTAKMLDELNQQDRTIADLRLALRGAEDRASAAEARVERLLADRQRAYVAIEAQSRAGEEMRAALNEVERWRARYSADTKERDEKILQLTRERDSARGIKAHSGTCEEARDEIRELRDQYVEALDALLKINKLAGGKPRGESIEASDVIEIVRALARSYEDGRRINADLTKECDDYLKSREAWKRASDAFEIERDRATTEVERLRGIIADARYCVEEDVGSAALRATLEGNGLEDGIAEELKSDLDRLRDERDKLRGLTTSTPRRERP